MIIEMKSLGSNESSTPLLANYKTQQTDSKIQKIKAAISGPLILSLAGLSTSAATFTVAWTNTELLDNTWFIGGLTFSGFIGFFCLVSACDLHFNCCKDCPGDELGK